MLSVFKSIYWKIGCHFCISVLNMYHSLHTVASITKGIINLIESEKGKLWVIFNHNAKRTAIDKHDQLRIRLITHA